jgi:ferredoxin
MVIILFIVLCVGVLVGTGAFVVVSVGEGERRAAFVGLGVGGVTSALCFLATFLPTPAQWVLLGLVVLAGALGVALFLLPVGRVERGRDMPTRRVDERDIMFARARLVPGTPNFESYYVMRPENKASDDKTRSLSGLLSPRAREANPLVFAATQASFSVTEVLRDAVDGPIVAVRAEHDAAAMTSYLKNLALYHGAHSAGITELAPYHVYSHIGRGSGEYGAPIDLGHRYALAFTVEMDRTMVGTGPAAPTVLESARQYIEAAKIAIQLANLMRSRGFKTRAHIDGNYRVIAPLVARDAGLGEIGRMGLLMTPTLGPRVRLGIVTTDMPLVPGSRGGDTFMIDFCNICQKCARACPVRAIPQDGREEIDGALRWKINADLCFRYWCVVGTDCGRCMAVCPFSHPDNWMHNGVRWAIRHSGMARRGSLWLDDVFYGREPAPTPTPSWIPHKPTHEQISDEGRG